MRGIAGNVLIGLAVLGAAGAVLIAGASIVEMWGTYPTSDRHVVAEGILLLAGALLGLDAIVFLTGRYWRQPLPGAASARRFHGARSPIIPRFHYSSIPAGQHGLKAHPTRAARGG